MALCIPKSIAASLTEKIAGRKTFIEDLYKMSSEDRRSMWEGFGVDPEMSIDINAGFEKAMISTQQGALKNWVESVFKGNEKKSKSRIKDIVSKINDLDKLGVLTPKSEDAFLQDLVATKLGATVTTEEAIEISKKAEEVKKHSGETNEFGLPTKEYFKAKREMENYLDSITPNSKLRTFTETIGRGTMLFSLKSPLLNIESNSLTGLLSYVERRMSSNQYQGLNGDYAKKYINYAREVFKESGYDVTRMRSLEIGRKQLGESASNSQGEGKVRAVGRFYEDIVFRRLLSEPDVFFSSFHFADSADLAATKIAKTKKLEGPELKAEALRIFKDATSIEPVTLEGQTARAQAIADAEYSTYTNDSISSKAALGIRTVFNTISGDLRLGDQMMPFVKTPANVIQMGIEMSGVTIPVEVGMKIAGVTKALREGTNLREALGENFAGFSRRLIRAGLGTTLAFILSSAIKPDDFVGEYPVSDKERQLLKLKNATPNSIKVGDMWISLDYFGPLGASLVGMLYAKKYGTSLPDAAIKYGKGVALQSAKIPGFTEFYNTVEAIKESRPDKDKGPGEFLSSMANTVSDFLLSRTVPALVYDYAKSSDSKERRVDYNNPLDKTKSKIPGLREQLPEANDVFGKTREGEGWKTLLFGSRVKTAQDSPLISELSRLEQTNNLPAISDITKTSSKAKELKTQIGDQKFEEAMQFFGKEFKKDTERLISDNYYRSLDDDEKKKEIDKVKQDNFEYTLAKYHYRTVPKENKK